MSGREQVTSSSSRADALNNRKPPIVIRPDRRSYLWPRDPIVPVRLNWSHVVKLGGNVLGVCILVSALILIFTRVSGALQGQSGSPVCIGSLICGQAGTVGSSAKSVSSPIVSQTATISASPVPTIPAGAAATSVSALPSPTPTSIYAVLSVQPSTITIAHYSVCNHKIAMVIQLQDVGGQPLIWRQGAKTSPGFSVNVSTNGYLIEPGQTVKVKLFCSPKDVKGKYHLEILYNGGSADIPVAITDPHS